MMKIKPCIILFVFFLSLYSRSWCGEPEKDSVSINFNNEPLRLVLQQLSGEYHFNFIFDDALIDSVFVTCKIASEFPHKAIEKLLRSYRFSYEFLNHNTIIINRKGKQKTPNHLISGRVYDAETGLPLVYANAYIQGKYIGSATDLDGRFSFTLPDSTFKLIVSYMGYETNIQQINPQSENLDISLLPRPFESGTIIVTAPPDREELEQINKSQLNEEFFIGVVPDISNEMPYASFMQYNDNEIYFANNESIRDYYIKITGNRLHPMIGNDRNNRLSLKQHCVKLNGFNLQMPFHTTAVPGINQGIVDYDLISNSNYYGTGFDVEYADAYESVMDLHYRKGNPDQVNGKAMIDLLNMDIMLEGPATDRASWIIFGKKSYFNDLIKSYQTNKWMSYGYYDIQTQLDIQPLNRFNTRINYIYSTDRISFDPKMGYVRQRTMQNSSSQQDVSDIILAEEHIQESTIDDSQFRLTGISVINSYNLSDHWKGELTITHEEQHHYNIHDWSVEHDFRLPDITDSTYNYLWSEGKNNKFKNKSLDEELILYYDASPAYSMKAGFQLQQSHYNTGVKNSLLVRIQDKISEPANYNNTHINSLSINRYTCFYQEERNLFSKLKVQTGLRYDYFYLQHKGRLNPRIVINYDLPKGVKAKAAYGAFSRLPEPGIMQQYMLEQFRSGYKPDGTKIEFQYIDKYMAGFQKTFSSLVLLDLRYSYKDMRNLVPVQRLSDGSLLYDVNNRAGASAHSLYIDTKLDFNLLTLMCRYKFTDSSEKNNTGSRYHYYADQKHSLLASINAELPDNWNIGLQVIYGSGYAYTKCVLPEYDWELGYDLDSKPIWEFQTDNPNAEWFPDYNRLDLLFSKRFILPFGKLSMSVKLINLLNTSQTFSYIYTYNQDGQPVRQSESLVPFFPQAGLAYEF